MGYGSKDVQQVERISYEDYTEKASRALLDMLDLAIEAHLKHGIGRVRLKRGGLEVEIGGPSSPAKQDE